MQNAPTHQNYSIPRGIKFHSRKILSFGFAHKDLGIKLITHLNLQGELFFMNFYHIIYPLSQYPIPTRIYTYAS